MLLLRILKKALPSGSAFFLAWASASYAGCVPDGPSERVKVDYVYDGDTVRLVDGRRIRLIGLNAPEIAKKGQKGEVFSVRSRAVLQELIVGSDVFLQLGRESQDRYGRWLGHLSVGSRLIAERMLEQGVAYHVAIPPNLSYSHCLRSAELRAVKEKIGVWGLGSFPWRNVNSLKLGEGGFRLLQGRVSAVKSVRSGWIVEVDDLLALKLSAGLVRSIGGDQLSKLQGKKLRVRGWIKPKDANAPSHYQPWFMSVAHKMHIELAL